MEVLGRMKSTSNWSGLIEYVKIRLGKEKWQGKNGWGT